MADVIQVGQRVTAPTIEGVWTVDILDEAVTPAGENGAVEIKNRLARVVHLDGPNPPFELWRQRGPRWFNFDQLTIVED